MGFCCWSSRNGENGELGKDVVKYMTTTGGDVAKQEGGTLKNGSPNRLDSEFVHSPRIPRSPPASQATRPRQPHDRVKNGHCDQKVSDGTGKLHVRF